MKIGTAGISSSCQKRGHNDPNMVTPRFSVAGECVYNSENSRPCYRKLQLVSLFDSKVSNLCAKLPKKLPFISSMRILLFTFLKLLSGIEGELIIDWGVRGRIPLCVWSCSCDSLFSSMGWVCTTSSSCGVSLFCPGTNECVRDTPRFTTDAFIAPAKSSSALKWKKFRLSTEHLKLTLTKLKLQTSFLLLSVYKHSLHF